MRGPLSLTLSPADRGEGIGRMVIPKTNGSPLNIGTMALDTFFAGAIGKVAVYDYLLSGAQITSHFRTMTGRAPTGSCASSCSL